jgi:hypothetical protein
MAYLPNLIAYDLDDFDPEDIEGSDDTYYGFDSIDGPPQPRQEQHEVFVRPGHDGETMRETGVRGVPYQIRTVLYVADRQDAVDALDAYVDLVDGLPKYLIINGRGWGYVRVLNVANAGMLPCGSVIGSLISSPTIKHVVVFTLLATEAPPEP